VYSLVMLVAVLSKSYEVVNKCSVAVSAGVMWSVTIN